MVSLHQLPKFGPHAGLAHWQVGGALLDVIPFDWHQLPVQGSTSGVASHLEGSEVPGSVVCQTVGCYFKSTDGMWHSGEGSAELPSLWGGQSGH